jgi:hypothetical protein
MRLIVKKKSIIKNWTSAPADEAALDSTSLGNAEWNVLPDNVASNPAGARTKIPNKLLDPTGLVSSDRPTKRRSRTKLVNLAEPFRTNRDVVDKNEHYDLVVPTHTGAPTVSRTDSITVADLLEMDLDLLKKKDAFMYYSIPGARNQDSDTAGLKRSMTVGKDLQSLVASTRKSVQGETPHLRRITSDSILQVKRQTRISYEVHCDVGLESLIEELVDLSVTDRESPRGPDVGELFEESIAKFLGKIPSDE